MGVGEQININTTFYNYTEVEEDPSKQPRLDYINQTIYQYSMSYVEFFYYQQPVVKKLQPFSGLTRGGTRIEVSGAWFAYKPEYGVIPHCKIGPHVTRAKYYSTVRVECQSPPNDEINQIYNVQFSLNGHDFIDTGFHFRYY